MEQESLFEKVSIEETVQKYNTAYPGHTEFINDFIERFPLKSDFEEKMYDYYDEDEDDEDEDEESRRERLWSPETEVYMLEQEVAGEYPGDEIWVNFYNDLLETDWNNEK